MNRIFRTRRSEKEEVINLLRNIEGQISRDEIFKLYSLAKEVNKGECIVEIGSYRGKSTLALAVGSKKSNNCPVYSIDPHANFVGVAGWNFGPADLAIKYQNICKLKAGELVYCICLRSEQVSNSWEQPIGLLWIDGDHRYEAVKKDFFGFKPFLSENAKIAFHDSNMEGVNKFISELVDQKHVTIINKVDLITIATINHP